MSNPVRTTKYYKQDNSDRKQIRFGELLERINKSRGETPFSEWVKSACEDKLERDERNAKTNNNDK